MSKTSYIKVILDANATVVYFECTLLEEQYRQDEVIGKNWFTLFISKEDTVAVMEVFHGLFQDMQVWESYKNDIICKDGHQKYLDFHNQIFIRDGEKYINSVGIEHFTNEENRLYDLARSLSEPSDEENSSVLDIEKMCTKHDFSSLLNADTEKIRINGGARYLFSQLKNHHVSVSTLKELAEELTIKYPKEFKHIIDFVS